MNSQYSSFTIDENKCINCGLCAEICLVYSQESSQMKTVFPNLCIGCGHCESVCPASAITGPVPVVPIDKDYGEKIPSPESLQLLLQTRRSVRRYKPQPIKDSDIEKILEAGRYTPTGSNSQDIGYIIVNDPDKMAEIRQVMLPLVARMFAMASRIAALPFAAKILGENQAHKLRNVYGPAVALFMDRNANGDDRLFYNAPALMLVHGEKQDEAMAFSCHMAMFSCSLMAHTLDIGCLLNSFALMAINRSRKLKNMIGVPKGHKCFGAMTLGYQNIKYRTLINRKPVNVRII